MMGIRLIACDLDGTLLGGTEGRYGILPSAVAALRKAAHDGISVAIITGRDYGFIRSMLEREGVDPARDLWPAVIVAEERLIYVREGDDFVPDAEWNRKIVATERSRFEDIRCLVADLIQGELGRIDPAIRRFPEEVEAARGFVEIVFQDPDRARLGRAELERRLRADGLPYAPVRNLAGVAVRHVESGKGRSLLQVCRMLGLNPGEALAVGDSGNDLSMLDGALGFVPAAPGNAEVEVKEVVLSAGGFVAQGGRGDGVAEAINAFCHEAMAKTNAAHIVITKRTPGLDEALAQLPESWTVWVNEAGTPNEALRSEVCRATALLAVGDRVDRDILAAAPGLKVVSNYGVGVDNIDLEAAREHGVAVTNLPDEVTYTTAELALALMLASARRIAAADRYVRSRNPFEWTPRVMIGRNLLGKRLGLIGFGRIGQRVARMAQAFEMEVAYYARRRNEVAERAIGARYLDLEPLLATSDVVSLHVPATKETYRLIDRNALAKMKRDAILINTARGSVVDEAALAEALASGALAAAGLDVYEEEPRVNPELLRLDNVVLTPHVGSSTIDARVAMTHQAVANIRAVLSGEEPSSRAV